MNGTLRANGAGGSRTDRQPLVARTLLAHHRRDDGETETLVPVGPDVAATLQAHRGAGGGGLSPEETLVTLPVADTLTSGSATERAPGRRQEDDSNLVAGTLRSHPRPGSNSDGAITAFNVVPEGGQGADLRATEVDIALAVAPQTGSYDRGLHMTTPVGVRRLTPTECERLMGWPDGWTAPEGIKAPDTSRYAACGDGVVANVSEWIARRIIAIDNQETT